MFSRLHALQDAPVYLAKTISTKIGIGFTQRAISYG
jgi:hypothetical protein